MRRQLIVVPLSVCLLSFGLAGCPEPPATPDAAMDLAAGRDMPGDARVSSADAAHDGAAGELGSPALEGSLTVFEGTYFVPERRPVSSYAVDDVRWTRIGTRALLDYQLPRLLDGRGTRVRFAGDIEVDGSALLEGVHGTAACQVTAQGLPVSCLERFVGLDVDLERVRREAEEADPERVEERVEVARQFRNDPIGVLETETVVATRVAAVCQTVAECAAGEQCEREAGEALGICQPE